MAKAKGSVTGIEHSGASKMASRDGLELVRRAADQWARGGFSDSISHGQRKETYATDSGIPLKPLYTPVDMEEVGFDYLNDLGFPGLHPYARGAQPAMYRKDLWIIGGYAGYGSPKETNRWWKRVLAKGSRGLSTAFDLPTQLGLDSDDPRAAGEVGKVGMPIDSLKDFEDAFEGIPLNSIGRMSSSASTIAPLILAMFLAIAEKQGVDPRVCTVTLQTDPFNEFLARGFQVFPVRPSLRLATDLIEYCAKYVPNWCSMTVCANAMKNCGASPVQALAFSLANAITYIEATVERGLYVDQFVPSWQMYYGVASNFFEEIATLRAARKLWARILKERFGAKDPRSLAIYLYTPLTGSTMTAQQPLNNIVRITLQVLACVLGGTQLITPKAYDEALSIPSEEAYTVGIRTQQIVAEETGIPDVIDPLGGSYFIETLTKQVEERVMQYLDTIDAMGGAVAALEQGYFDRELADAAYRRQKAIESGEATIIGVNKYADSGEGKVDIFRVNPEGEKRQIERLQEVRRNRDGNKVKRALGELRLAAQGTENLIPPILEAVKAYATTGEIYGVLREVFGEYEYRHSL